MALRGGTRLGRNRQRRGRGSGSAAAMGALSLRPRTRARSGTCRCCASGPRRWLGGPGGARGGGQVAAPPANRGGPLPAPRPPPAAAPPPRRGEPPAPRVPRTLRYPEAGGSGRRREPQPRGASAGTAGFALGPAAAQGPPRGAGHGKFPSGLRELRPRR
ncbi:unnamed protein product [Coccothraustes coccothraustes]